MSSAIATAAVNGNSNNNNSSIRTSNGGCRSNKITVRRENSGVDGAVDGSADAVVEVPAWKRELLLKRRTYNWMATLLSSTSSSPPSSSVSAAFKETIDNDNDDDDEASAAAADRHYSPEIRSINHASTGNSTAAIHAQLNNGAGGGGGGGGGGDTVQLSNQLCGIHADPEPQVAATASTTANSRPKDTQQVRATVDMAADVKSASNNDSTWCRSSIADDQVSVSQSPTHSDWFGGGGGCCCDDEIGDHIGGGGDELEYGPGIVNRLRSKFISMTLKIGATNATSSAGGLLSPVRRVASMEHLLDVRDDPVILPLPLPTKTKFVKNQAPVNGNAAVQRYNTRSTSATTTNNPWTSQRRRGAYGTQRSSSVSPTTPSDVLKRARSMETLSDHRSMLNNNNNNAFGLLRPTPTSIGFLGRSFSTSSSAKDDLMLLSPPLTTLALVNENVIIIEQTKPFSCKGDHSNVGKGPSLSTLRYVAKDSGALQADDEFPKPDTVRTFKRIFEPTDSPTSAPSSAAVSLIAADALQQQEPSFMCKKSTAVAVGGGSSQVQRKVTPPPKPLGLKPKPNPRPPMILNGCADGGAKYGPRPSRIPTSPKRVIPTPTPVPRSSDVEPAAVVVDVEPEVTKVNGDDTLVSASSDVISSPEDPINIKSSPVVDIVESPAADIQGAKRSGGTVTEDLDYVLAHLKPVAMTTANDHVPSSLSSVAAATAAVTMTVPQPDKPKVVSIQPKLDEKPVGHIRPFQSNVEQQKNKVNDLKSTEEAPSAQVLLLPAVIICDEKPVESMPPPSSSQLQPQPMLLPSQVTKKASPQRSAAPVTQTFNFVGKDVQPHIANTTAPFSVKRPALIRNVVDKVDGNSSRNKENFGPGSSDGSSTAGSSRHGNYIIAGTDVDASWRNYVDEEDEDEEDDDDPIRNYGGGLGDVVFVGCNVIVGRSALLKNRNKKLKIAFDDTAVSTYEYPSEGSLLEDVANKQPVDADNRLQQNGDFAGRPMHSSSSVVTSDDDDRSNKDLDDDDDDGGGQSTFATEMQANRSTAVSLKSTPAIGSTGGLSSYTPMAVGSGSPFELGMSPRVPQQKLEDVAAVAVAEEDIFLKPATDEQNSAWSNSDTVDLLF